MSSTAARRCGVCLWSTWNGVLRSLNDEPRNEMRRPLRSGSARSGRREKTRRLGAYLAFVEVSGFLLIPTVRRTWAPRGKTPLLYHSYRRDRISTISAPTVSPRRGRLGLYVGFHRKNITDVEVAEFLRHLLRHLHKPIVLLWDGGSIHRRRLVKEYPAGSHSRLHVYRFPAYAPELNPDEYVWTQSKHSLANATPRDIDELGQDLRKALGRIGRSQQLLKACLCETALSFEQMYPLLYGRLITPCFFRWFSTNSSGYSSGAYPGNIPEESAARGSHADSERTQKRSSQRARDGRQAPETPVRGGA